MAHHSRIFDKKSKLILLIIVIIAAFFRFYNLDWDLGHFFHPDERNIANAVSALTLFSQMDPKFYAYGGFLIYLYKVTADILAIALNNPAIPHDWGFINVIGRSYSAFFSTLTIIPLFFLSSKLFDRKTGFLASIIYALTVSSIQTAHFSTTESLLTFLITLITCLALIFYENTTKRNALLIGLVLGVAVATKTTGIAFIVSPVVTIFLLFIRKKLSSIVSIKYLLIIALAGFLVYCIFSPYTFLNFDKFIESMHYENSVVLGTNPVVYTLQFLHTTPYLFQLKNLLWQLGLFAAIAIAGTITISFKEFHKKNWQFIIFISFPLLYFAYVGSWYTKFNRYMVPIFPFIIICGSYCLWLVAKKSQLLGRLLILFTILITGLYAAMYLSIYTRPQTRIKTSEWIYSHIPKGSFILSEHWDDGQPIPLPGGSPNDYETMPLAIYDPDDNAKVIYYSTYLSQADYLTINSRRLYGTLMHLPKRYPLTKHYYELLFSGRLGYKKVAEFTSYPQIFGLTLNDDSSEETFQVYDHPKTFIFKNKSHLSAKKIQSILLAK